MDLESSSNSNQEAQTDGRWSKEEHDRFIKALMAHGKNWKLIENIVETRTTSQVRSHAQKFFLKIIKIEKERKKNLKKGILLASKADQELLKSLSQQSISSNTPIEILHFLKKESKEGQSKKEQPESLEPLTFKSQTGCRKNIILQEMFSSKDEESFLVSLMYHINRYSKHNFNFLDKQQAFSSLIDFPELQKQQKEEEQTSSKRKISFSPYDEEDDQNKNNQMIKKVKEQ